MKKLTSSYILAMVFLSGSAWANNMEVTFHCENPQADQESSKTVMKLGGTLLRTKSTSQGRYLLKGKLNLVLARFTQMPGKLGGLLLSRQVEAKAVMETHGIFTLTITPDGSEKPEFDTAYVNFTESDPSSPLSWVQLSTGENYRLFCGANKRP